MERAFIAFAGTNSYYGSCAEAYFTGTYVLYAAIAIIVVIIIGLAATVLLLKKR